MRQHRLLLVGFFVGLAGLHGGARCEAQTVYFRANVNSRITDYSQTPNLHDQADQAQSTGNPAVLTPISVGVSDNFGGGSAQSSAGGRMGLLQASSHASYSYIVLTGGVGGYATTGATLDANDVVTVTSSSIPAGTFVLVDMRLAMGGSISPPYSAQLRPGIDSSAFANMTATIINHPFDPGTNVTLDAPRQTLADLTGVISVRVGDSFNIRYGLQTTAYLTSDIPDIRSVDSNFSLGARLYLTPQNPAVSLTAASGYAYAFTPPHCVADIGVQGGVPGHDNVLDNNDFIVFIDAFFNHDPQADMGQQGGVPGSDGTFDNNDFIVFIDAFFNRTGCP